jgi:hypothetical protein
LKVLLLDTAFAAAPVYAALKDAGHDVWVMGNRPMDQLAQIAGANWINHSYSDVAFVNEEIKRLGIEAVVPGCTDVSIEAAVKLDCGATFRDSFETNQILSHKGKFRALCSALDLPAPRKSERSSFPKAGRFICKPVDAFSGRGISVFDGLDSAALSSAVEKAEAASPTSTIVIEDFAGDELYSCSGFLRNHALTDFSFVREASSANPYAVDTSYVSYDFPKEAGARLTEGLEKLSRHLQLKDGLLHTQFLMFEGRPMIVEVSRRCPGDLYPLLIEYSRGLRYAAKYALTFLGESVETGELSKRHVLRHTVTADEKTGYGGLIFKAPVPIKALYTLAQLGDPLLPRQGNRAAILFCEYATRQELLTAYESHLNRKTYGVTGEI